MTTDEFSIHIPETEVSYENWADSKGLLHRLGGSAIIYTGQYIGKFSWYIHGESYSFKEYCRLAKPLMSETDYFTMLLTYE